MIFSALSSTLISYLGGRLTELFDATMALAFFAWIRRIPQGRKPCEGDSNPETQNQRVFLAGTYTVRPGWRRVLGRRGFSHAQNTVSFP